MIIFIEFAFPFAIHFCVGEEEKSPQSIGLLCRTLGGGIGRPSTEKNEDGGLTKIYQLKLVIAYLLMDFTRHMVVTRPEGGHRRALSSIFILGFCRFE